MIIRIIQHYYITHSIYIRRIEMKLELLQVYKFDKKTRCGSNCDGGYVLAELDCKYDCYISAGISDEESFSRDFITPTEKKNETN
jgi:hypothetical protein